MMQTTNKMYKYRQLSFRCRLYKVQKSDRTAKFNARKYKFLQFLYSEST